MFEVYAFLTNPHKTIFNGTTNWLPRIGEEMSINFDVFRVKNVRYILRNGTTGYTEVHISLEVVN